MMEHKCIVCCIRHTCIKVDEVFLLFWKRMYTDFGQLKRMSKVDIYLYIFCYLESYLLSCLISSLLYIEIFCHRSPKKSHFLSFSYWRNQTMGTLVSWFALYPDSSLVCILGNPNVYWLYTDSSLVWFL